MNTSNRPTFTPGLVHKVGAISRVLTDFLDKQAERIQQELESRFPSVSAVAVRKVLNSFVSLEGTKKPLHKDKIHISGLDQKMLTDCLTALENARIIRYDEGLYELSHDTLARHIDEQRSAEEVDLLKLKKLVADRKIAFSATGVYLNQKELNFVEAYRDRLQEEELLGEEEWRYVQNSKREAGRLQRRRWIMASAIMLVLAATTVIAVWQMTKAQQLARENALRSYEVLVTQATAAFGQIEYDKAAEIYREALSLARENVGAIADTMPAFDSLQLAEDKAFRRERFNQLIMQGDSLREDVNDPDLVGALRQYQEALSLEYDSTTAQNRVSSIRMEDVKRMISDVQSRAEEISRSAMLDGGKVRKNKYLDAKKLYEKALSLNEVFLKKDKSYESNRKTIQDNLEQVDAEINKLK